MTILFSNCIIIVSIQFVKDYIYTNTIDELGIHDNIITNFCFIYCFVTLRFSLESTNHMYIQLWRLQHKHNKWMRRAWVLSPCSHYNIDKVSCITYNVWWYLHTFMYSLACIQFCSPVCWNYVYDGNEQNNAKYME